MLTTLRPILTIPKHFKPFATITTMPIPTTKSDVTIEISGQINVDKYHAVSRDFRSDTFTVPTDAQMMASLTASRGDDVYMEDESTRLLEERIARLTGKEDALFAVSGTMTNREC